MSSANKDDVKDRTSRPLDFSVVLKKSGKDLIAAVVLEALSHSVFFFLRLNQINPKCSLKEL